MKKKLFPAVLIAILLISATYLPAQDAGLVDITGINKNILLDIKYATTDNFLGEAVYPAARCFVVRPMAGSGIMTSCRAQA